MIKASKLHPTFVVVSSLHIMPTLIFKIKTLISFECKYQIISINLLVFVDAGENSIMSDDVIIH